MSILAIDLGGTKQAVAVFTNTGELLIQETLLLESRTGEAVGKLITNQSKKLIQIQQRTE